MSSNHYYEILGIRPNAGRGEIELAYKGRRSQYHPDRYAQADAETQAWATVKMQEVNEAYQALASSDSRPNVERRGASDRSTDNPPRQERAASAPEIKDAASILLKPEWQWSYDNVYARPNIPRRKLEGAISSYAPEVSPEEVIVLLDDTVFGGAKEGLLVTNEAVYCKEYLENPKRVPLSAIQQVEPGTKSRVLINGQEFFKAVMIEHLAVSTFTSRLSAVLKQTSKDETPSDSGTKKPGVGVEGLLTLHRAAIAVLRGELGDGALLIDDLIDRQMRGIADHFSSLRKAIESKPRPRHGSTDAESAELALMLFLILHYYAFSQLPSAFKEEMGDEFAQLHGVSEVYKTAFMERFPGIYARGMRSSEEELLAMSAAFFHRDGEGGLETSIPREEALTVLFSRLGIGRETSRGLVRQFQDQAESWLEAISEPGDS